VKIGLVCPYIYPESGGVAQHVRFLYENLRLHGHDVRIITASHGPQRASEGDILRIGVGFSMPTNGSVGTLTFSPRYIGQVRSLLARERFDLLHIHAPCDIGLPSWALWTFDGPIVGTIHSYFSHTKARTLAAPWYRYVMRRMTRVIAVSEAARDTIARYANFDCTIIGNGVDCDAFEAGRPMAKFADGMTNILSVGRLEHRNGIDLMIDAFALLARDRPTLRLLLAGEGPSRAAYEAQVGRLPTSIATRVVFLGAVWGERANLYASAHCFALGARKTSF